MESSKKNLEIQPDLKGPPGILKRQPSKLINQNLTVVVAKPEDLKEEQAKKLEKMQSHAKLIKDIR